MFHSYFQEGYNRLTDCWTSDNSYPQQSLFMRTWMVVDGGDLHPKSRLCTNYHCVLLAHVTYSTLC